MYTRLLLGGLALVVSLYYSWRFVSAGAVLPLDIVVAAVFVLVTEGGKILFMGDTIHHARAGHHEAAFWSGSLVLVLFLLSISATAYNLITAAAQERSGALLQDTRYQSTQARLESLRGDISAAQAALAACPRGHSTNCIQPRTDDLAQLRAQERSALADMESLPASSLAGGGAFWSQVAGALGFSSDGLQTAWAYLRGLLLEVLGLVLVGQGLAGLRSASAGAAPAPVWNQTGQAAGLSAVGQPVGLVAGPGQSGNRPAGSFDTGTEPGQDSRFQSVRSAILAGDVPPSTGQLRKKFRCDYTTAAAYLSALASEGLLQRDSLSGQYRLN